MSSNSRSHGFQAWGAVELHEAIRAEIQQAEQLLREPKDEVGRGEAQEKLDSLRRELDLAINHGRKWLF